MARWVGRPSGDDDAADEEDDEDEDERRPPWCWRAGAPGSRPDRHAAGAGRARLRPRPHLRLVGGRGQRRRLRRRPHPRGRRAHDPDLAADPREDVYPQRRLHGPWLYLQQRDSVYANTGLRAIIEEGIAFERLEDAPSPSRWWPPRWPTAASGGSPTARRWRPSWPRRPCRPSSPPLRSTGSATSTVGSSTTCPSIGPSRGGPPGSWCCCALPPVLRPVTPAPGRGDAQRPVAPPA